MWFSDNWRNEENYIEWSLDISASDRDTIIEEIKDYMKKNGKRMKSSRSLKK